jgi:tryptophan synthase alpha chain
MKATDPFGRIPVCFRRNAERNEKVLALFLTAGYPTLDATPKLVLELEQAGADIIEIGMPFSDPIADGPVIQQSSATALKNGVKLPYIVKTVKHIRTRSSIPIVLMGYLNPILQYGQREFFEDVAAAGVDGIILPELPLEESDRFDESIRAAGIAHIHLVTPTSTENRIRRIDAVSKGFLYCVSTTGVTGGTGIAVSEQYLRRVKLAATRNPVLVGFGISGPDEAKRYARVADGVIIGSALLSRLATEPLDSTVTWVRAIKRAMGE